MGNAASPIISCRQTLERNHFKLNRLRSRFLVEHDLVGKPVPTFPDHALRIRIDRLALTARPLYTPIASRRARGKLTHRGKKRLGIWPPHKPNQRARRLEPN